MQKFDIAGIEILAKDFEGSVSAPYIAKELARDCYGVKKINFKAGDIVLDLGGNIGLFSIWLAKQWPQIKIYSFEPLIENYENLLHNLVENQIKNVIPFYKAITGDGRRVQIATPKNVSGGASLRFDRSYNGDPNLIYRSFVDSWTLNECFSFLKLDQVKLLKIDCEGSEFEILPACSKLYKIEYLSGEFHKTPKKEHEKLLAYCQKYIEKDKINLTYV